MLVPAWGKASLGTRLQHLLTELLCELGTE